MVTNLPAGKIFNNLIEGTAKGDLYIDGSFDSMILSEPLRFKVNDGIATDIKGGRKLKESDTFLQKQLI